MNSNSKTKFLSLPMIIALLLILGGGFFAYLVQTGGGDIEVRDVRFMGSTYMGNPGAPPLEKPVHVMMSALLYIPPGVNAKNKAPGVVAVHGYYNSRETQDGFAIEFARRGYVVLAIDQPGHGYSDPPAFANGFGGIDALKYLRSLDFVDPDNIALEGHSMGGWAIAIAAAVIPNGYKSFICASSATGLPMFGVPEGTATYPRNFALIYSLYDEFSGFFWGAPIPKDIVNSDKLKKQFGTTETVEVGKLYGSIEDGTARKLYMPSMIHPRVHFSKEAIGDAVEWLEMTLDGGNNLTPSKQSWYWKEIFTFVALIGMVIFMISLGGYLLDTKFFQDLKGEPPQQKSLSGWGWWVGAIVMIGIPLYPYWYYWSKKHLAPGLFSQRFIWPEQITNIVMFWALTVGAIALILFLLWHFIINKKTGATWADYGAPWVIIPRLKSLLFAIILIFFVHLTVVFSGWLFLTDFRLWVIAIKPLNALRFGVSLGYIIPFLFYFCVLGLVLHGQMRPGKDNTLSMGKEVITNILLLIIGPIILLLFQYLPILSGGELMWAGFNLGGIFLFQIIAIFTIIGIIMTYFYRKTGRIFVGSYVSAMFVTWVIVASQVIHYTYQ